MIITAPNHTQIPNSLLDEWMPLLSDGELRVLLCFCRKTFGWHKQRDEISLSQIAKATGLSKPSLPKIIARLIEKGLVKKTTQISKHGDPDTNIYELVVCAPEQGGSNLGLPGVVISDDQGVVILDDLQKKDITKERPTKEEAPARSPDQKIQRREHVSTTQAEHERLLADFGEEIVKACYDELNDWKMNTPKKDWKLHDNLSIRKWVVDAVKEKSKKQRLNGSGSIEDQNRLLSQSVIKKFNGRHANGQILDSGKYIEFTNRFHPNPVELYYEANGFREQLLNILRKLGLPTDGI